MSADERVNMRRALVAGAAIAFVGVTATSADAFTYYTRTNQRAFFMGTATSPDAYTFSRKKRRARAALGATTGKR